MVAFFSRRFVRWLLMLLAVPIAVWLADTVAERLEAGKGSSTLTRALRMPGRWRRGEPLLAD